MRKVIFFLFFAINSDAEYGHSNSNAPPNTTSLPRCFDDRREIETVLQTIDLNKRNSNKYDGYKKILNNSSDPELLARLAYAETIAANCPGENSQIAPVVAGVIRNRAVTRKGEAASVVFDLNQFSSSLHNYTDSRFREFLCPKDLVLWRIVFSEVQKTDSSFSSKAYQYYFFRHSDGFQAPSWALGPKALPHVIVPISEGEKPCVRAYINPQWR